MTADEEEFRETLREFLEKYHPGPEPSDPEEKLAFQRAWAACLHDHGWAAPSWPRRWGGMELPVDKLVPYYEELALARVPAHPSPNAFIVGPTILALARSGSRSASCCRSCAVRSCGAKASPSPAPAPTCRRW